MFLGIVIVSLIICADVGIVSILIMFGSDVFAQLLAILAVNDNIHKKIPHNVDIFLKYINKDCCKLNIIGVITSSILRRLESVHLKQSVYSKRYGRP